MFTGIIEGVGKVSQIVPQAEGARLEVDVDFDLERSNVGESIAVNGCCLTITSRLGRRFWADLSAETLQRTTLGSLQPGDPVNLERALQLGQRLGGHLVQGHVDGIGKIIEINCLKSGVQFILEIPDNLVRYVVDKGSIAVDGVSLTVNRCEENRCSVTVVPHTQLVTTFSRYCEGALVNLEVDILGKYVEKLHFLDSEQHANSSDVVREFLKKHGF